MARLPDRSSRFMLIATFIICSSILFVDFRFDTFKPVQNFYNSSSIFIRVFSSEYIVRPLYRSLSSMRDTRRAKEENKNLKEELNKQLIENYIISNKEILNRNIKLRADGEDMDSDTMILGHYEKYNNFVFPTQGPRSF